MKIPCKAYFSTCPVERKLANEIIFNVFNTAKKIQNIAVSMQAGDNNCYEMFFQILQAHDNSYSSEVYPSQIK